MDYRDFLPDDDELVEEKRAALAEDAFHSYF
jgi:hypothetical protein